MTITIDWPRLGRAALILWVAVSIPPLVMMVLMLRAKPVADFCMTVFVVAFLALCLVNLIGAVMRVVRPTKNLR